MLCKLSLKNIKKSMKDYAIYFFTLIVGVAIFYVFNAIETQTVMMNVTSSTRDIIRMMTTILNVVSVFVAFVLGFLIIYASRFLMTRRNKEFALYLIMGMGKRKISFILFFETLLIGCISLAVGLLVGTGASQLMSVVVANMFEADMEKFQFVFSVAACKKTVLYFGIMYVFVMLFNTVMIGKCKLIELLQASKKSEKVKMKNPWVCILVFIVAAVALAYAYYQVTVRAMQMSRSELITVIVMGIVSTVLVFWSISGLALKLVMRFKNVYFKGLNSFTLRQISSKINTTVMSMSVTCLMLFMTICVLSSCISMTESMNAVIDDLAAADITISRKLLDLQNSNMHEDNALPVEEIFDKNGTKLNEYFNEYIEADVFRCADVTLEDSLGEYLGVAKEQYQFMVYSTMEDVMSLSDYNKVAGIYGNEEFTLADDEYMVIADFENMVRIRNAGLASGIKLNVFGHELTPKYAECKPGYLDMASNHINIGIVVVPDYILEGQQPVMNYVIGNYAADGKKEKAEAEQAIMEQMDAVNRIYMDSGKGWYGFTLNTKIDITQAAVGLSAMAIFVGMYLGVVFLIASAAIFALKELTESADNIERFRMLRKLGADEKMINSALFKQIGIFFAAPLLVAGIHSIFGIQFCEYILSTFGNEKMMASIISTAGIIVAIYGGYFVITYLCSKAMIKSSATRG